MIIPSVYDEILERRRHDRGCKKRIKTFVFVNTREAIERSDSRVERYLNRRVTFVNTKLVIAYGLNSKLRSRQSIFSLNMTSTCQDGATEKVIVTLQGES
jgi:hypothetical protein